MAEDFLVEAVNRNVKKELLQQLEHSMKEELQAAEVYRRRGDYARRGYPSPPGWSISYIQKLAEVYDHVRKEEEEHYREFQEAADKLRKES
jgi:rubrerythrin